MNSQMEFHRAKNMFINLLADPANFVPPQRQFNINCVLLYHVLCHLPRESDK